MNFGNGVKDIGKLAFAECKRLPSITIPDSVISIDESAFSTCIRLTSVNFGNGIKRIGRLAFAKCKSLNSISAPSSMVSIGEGAFGKSTNVFSEYIFH